MGWALGSRCKHGKVDQNSAPVYENHDFLVKGLKVVA